MLLLSGTILVLCGLCLLVLYFSRIKSNHLPIRTELRESERLLYVARKHWFVLVRPIILLLADIIFFIINGTEFLFISAPIFIAAASYFIYAYCDRQVNIWAITNHRLIDEWGVFSHMGKETPLDKINNVSIKKDIPARIFGYGDVEIQTAAENGTVIVKMVQYPDNLLSAINDAINSANVVAKHNDDFIECPFCAEHIKKKATVCRYCGNQLFKKGDSYDIQ
jgi:membrane protein YdbS with pleckstrin-like domain